MIYSPQRLFYSIAFTSIHLLLAKMQQSIIPFYSILLQVCKECGTIQSIHSSTLIPSHSTQSMGLIHIPYLIESYHG